VAKTPQQANQKWIDSTSTGEQTWVDNLNQTTKPIVQAAINARSRMQANFAAATQAGGKWETRLSAVGDSGVKAAATKKRANYTTGVSNAGAKQLAAITKIIAYENANLPTIEQMKAAGSGGKARMDAWYDIMKAGAGQLGA
jgi:hypothetical protein